MSSKSMDPPLAGNSSNPSAQLDGTVIRYSPEFLIACSKSPLVERPEALPPTSVWFGEVVKEEVEINNGPRRGSSKSSGPERIVLGPPKMSFASSSLGGLKRSDDNMSGFKKSAETLREGRAPRGPPSALEQGFGRETIEKLSSHKLLPKVTPKDITGLLSGMDRRRVDSSRMASGLTGQRQPGTSTSTSTSSGLKLGATRTSGQYMSTSLSSNGGGLNRSQRSDAPEWMSYNPDAEDNPKDDEADGAFVDDIQAWKARMKEHERREKEKEIAAQNQRDGKTDPKGPSRADSSSSWRSNVPVNASGLEDGSKALEDHRDDAILEGQRKAPLVTEPIQDIDLFFRPGGIDLTKPFDASSSAFDKFFSQHTNAVSSFEDPTQQKPTRPADGSRFARFFAEDEPEPTKETEQARHTTGNMPGKQLSLDQLFQSHTPTAATPAPPPLGRMPSEAEILQSMSAPRSATSAPPVSDSNGHAEDAFAFQKIMAALSKAPVGGSDPPAALAQHAHPSKPTNSYAPAPLPSTNAHTPGAHHDPSILSYQSKPLLESGSAKKLADESEAAAAASTPSLNTVALDNSSSAASQGSAGPTSATTSTPSSTPSTPAETPRPTSRPVQVAFGGGIPTSVYRQLSGKTDGQKSSSPLIRPLTSANGNGSSGGGSPSLSSPSVSSPRQFHAQANAPGAAPPHHNQPSMQQQQQHLPKNFGPYSQGPQGAVMHSPVMDPRMSGMYGNNAPPMSPHGHGMDEAPAYFNGMPMQRPPQGVPPFGQQLPPFSQQMHVSGPGEFMPPHPSQFVGMPPPFPGHPMHPGMFPLNPVEMLMHRGPGGPPPRPHIGMGPGPGPNHFVPNTFGHPMNGMAHPGLPMNAPPFFPPQASKPMMTREEYERRNRQ